MSIGLTPSTTQANAAITQALNSDQELGRDAFLRLLVAQLQNQDPLEPVKNEAFVAQLAQFSSLEQLTLINENLADDAGTEATTDVRLAVDGNTAVSLIGREVQVPSDNITYSGEGSVRLGYNVEGPSDVVRLRVVDQSGTIVNTLVDGSPEQGNASIIWNGKDAEGNFRAKPAADPILAAIERCGAQRLAFVGDSTYDVMAARAAGVPVVAAGYGYCDKPPHELGADTVIDRFDALIPALEAL